MANAFQSDAFQNDAFQTGGAATVSFINIPWISVYGVDAGLLATMRWTEFSGLAVWQNLVPTSSTNATLVIQDGYPTTQVTAFVAAAHAQGLNALLCIYGAGDLDAICADTTLRANLVTSLVSWMTTYSADGCVIDWEGTADQSNYVSLCSQLKAAAPTKLVCPIGICVSGAPYQNGGYVHPTASINSYVDYIFCMTYDAWLGPAYMTSAQMIASLDAWVAAGFPKTKLLAGIPFHAVHTIPADGGWTRYIDMVTNYGLTNPNQSVYGSGASAMEWNSVTIVKQKVADLISNGFSGVWGYEQNEDALSNLTMSLDKAIYDAIVTGGQTTTGTPVTFTATNGTSEIWVDGVFKGYTSQTFNLASGSHSIGFFGAPNYVTYTGTATVGSVALTESCDMFTGIITENGGASIPPSSQGGLIVPLYCYPGAYWSQLIAAKTAYPNVPMIAVVNVSSGPGVTVDANYTSGIASLQAAGITVVGYVWHTYDINQINAWKTLYPTLTGIFFDGYGDGRQNAATDQAYVARARTVFGGSSLVIGNPGAFAGVNFPELDIICTYEGAGYPSTALVTSMCTTCGGASRVAILCYSVSSLNAAAVSWIQTQPAGWVYLTNDVLGADNNPWDIVPTYISPEAAALSTGSSVKTILPFGISTSEAFGYATLTKSIKTLYPSGVTSGEAFGAPLVVIVATVGPTPMRLRLVDGTTTIDIYNSTAFRLVEDGLDIGDPPVKSKNVVSDFANGDPLASVRYGNRTITATLKISGTTISDLKSNIRAIEQMLNSAETYSMASYHKHGFLTATGKVYLELQWGDTDGESVFYEVVRGSLVMPTNFYSTYLTNHKIVFSATLTLECKPFALYGIQYYPSQLVNNGSYATVTAAAPVGDIPATLYLQVSNAASGWASGNKKLWVWKRSGDRIADSLSIEGESAGTFVPLIATSKLTTAASTVADATRTGGYFKRVTYSRVAADTVNDFVPSLIGYLPYTMVLPPRGAFRVLAACRSSTGYYANSWEMGYGVGYSYGNIVKAPSAAAGEIYYPASNATWQILDLGLITIPPMVESDNNWNGSLELRIYHYYSGTYKFGFYSGAGNPPDYYDIDTIYLMSVDEGYVIVDNVGVSDCIGIDGISEPNSVLKLDNAATITGAPDYVGAPFALGKGITTRIYALRDDLPAVQLYVEAKYQPRFMKV